MKLFLVLSSVFLVSGRHVTMPVNGSLSNSLKENSFKGQGFFNGTVSKVTSPPTEVLSKTDKTSNTATLLNENLSKVRSQKETMSKPTFNESLSKVAVPLKDNSKVDTVLSKENNVPSTRDDSILDVDELSLEETTVHEGNLDANTSSNLLDDLETSLVQALENAVWSMNDTTLDEETSTELIHEMAVNGTLLSNTTLPTLDESVAHFITALSLEDHQLIRHTITILLHEYNEKEALEHLLLQLSSLLDAETFQLNDSFTTLLSRFDSLTLMDALKHLKDQPEAQTIVKHPYLAFIIQMSKLCEDEFEVKVNNAILFMKIRSQAPLQCLASLSYLKEEFMKHNITLEAHVHLASMDVPENTTLAGVHTLILRNTNFPPPLHLPDVQRLIVKPKRWSDQRLIAFLTRSEFPELTHFEGWKIKKGSVLPLIHAPKLKHMKTKLRKGKISPLFKLRLKQIESLDLSKSEPMSQYGWNWIMSKSLKRLNVLKVRISDLGVLEQRSWEYLALSPRRIKTWNFKVLNVSHLTLESSLKKVGRYLKYFEGISTLELLLPDSALVPTCLDIPELQKIHLKAKDYIGNEITMDTFTDFANIMIQCPTVKKTIRIQLDIQYTDSEMGHFTFNDSFEAEWASDRLVVTQKQE
jgi:hypothetical protein